MTSYRIAVIGGTGPQGKGLAYRFAMASPQRLKRIGGTVSVTAVGRRASARMATSTDLKAVSRPT